MKVYPVLFFLATLAPACADVQRTNVDPEEAEITHVHGLMQNPFIVAAAARVRVLATENIGQATEAVGVIDVHERGEGRARALDELRAVAAEHGADAIVGVEFHHGEGGDAPTHLSGMAVRFRNLLRNEPFDVLAHIDVAADMEHEDEALAELQRRAGLLHADLVIHIAYEHGEGEGEPAHLTGVAIRYQPTQPNRATP